MPCYRPISIPKKGYADLRCTVACGRCIGCRLERSRQWAVRCVHEAQLHGRNCFITLTYNDEHLPSGGTLIKKHFQDFMKRLRRQINGRKISYFHCGEYGETCKQCGKSRRLCTCIRFDKGLGRPHYHAVLFGHDFPDQLLYRQNRRGDKVFTSATLSDLWGMGFCTVGACTFESAAYVARYITKKINGPQADGHYRRTDPETGESWKLLPEYITMSLKPAIAKDWYGQFSGDVYPDDFVVMRGKKMKPPKYYDRLYEKNHPEDAAANKEARRAYAATQKENQTPERLAVRENVKRSQITTLTRELE